MLTINKGLRVRNMISEPGTFRMLSLVAVIFIGLLSILATSSNSPVDPDTTAAFDVLKYVRTGSRVDLDARASRTMYASIKFIWSMESIPAGSSAKLTVRNVLNPSFIADMDGEYEIKLTTYTDYTVTGLESEATKTITAFSGNAPPVAAAGVHQEVLGGETVQLDGSQSYDADDDPLNYYWSFESGSSGTLSDETIVNPSFVANLDVNAVDTNHFLRLSVNDNQVDGTFYGVVIGSYLPGSSRPVVMAGPDQYVTTGSLVQLDGSGSYSLEVSLLGNPLLDYEWALQKRPFGSVAVLDNFKSKTPTFTADVAGAYLIGLKVHDVVTNHSNQRYQDGFANHKVVVFAGNGNIPPVADGGSDFIVNQGEEVTLNGSNSSDAENAILNYKWSIFKAPSGSSNALFSTNESTTQFIPDLDGTYLISFTVNDGQDDSAPDIVRIIANAINIVNLPPLANAGSDQASVTTGELVSLNGSASYDPENQSLSYMWSFSQQPAGGTATLLDNTAENPSFTPNVEGEYIIRLTVNDGQLDSIADTVSVIATDPSGVCSNPLTLQTGLPYLPGMGEAPTIFQIDASVIDTIRFVSFDDPSAYQNVSALQASIPDLDQISQADFISINANWTIFGRSHNNPVSDSESLWFILERQSDNIFFKIDVGFTGSEGLAEVQIDSLTACRCGANAGDCP